LGINYELTPYDDDVYYDGFSDDILKEIIHKSENLMAFLFADDIFYDTYADDCGSWEQQCEWEDTISEFIKESKNDVIELRDRC
jgi:predicted GIY-YIG superfamily endonuclease